jgi:hypothetical protein
VLDVSSSTTEDIIVVRIEMANYIIRVILAYAPQETEQSEIREDFFTDLEIEITKCKMADELPIVVGDLNAKIVKNNVDIEAITSNGKHLLELINNQELDVINFHEKCEGKWTHVIRTTNATSVLDYVLTSKQITNTVQQMIIDEQCILCPFCLKKSKGNQEPQYSDHNAIILRMEMCYEKKRPTNQPKSWRITDDGLQKLIQMTNEGFDCNNEGMDSQERYNNFENSITELMDECFQTRKTKKQKNQIPKEYLEIYKKITAFSKKGKAQRQVAKKYINEIIKTKTERVA